MLKVGIIQEEEIQKQSRTRNQASTTILGGQYRKYVKIEKPNHVAKPFYSEFAFVRQPSIVCSCLTPQNSNNRNLISN